MSMNLRNDYHWVLIDGISFNQFFTVSKILWIDSSNWDIWKGLSFIKCSKVLVLLKMVSFLNALFAGEVPLFQPIMLLKKLKISFI